MPQDVVRYLNDGANAAFSSRLIDLLTQSKIPRAPVSQWVSAIKSLSQKGLKQVEVDESGASAYLATLPSDHVLERDKLIEEIRRRYYTIKEVWLGDPQFPTYRQPGGEYREYLYLANSERDNVEDALELVNFEMEELAFDPELAITQPERIIALEERRASLMTKVKTAMGFDRDHYHDRLNGRLGKNLLVHCRVSIHGDTYFVDEMQSDWAQQGRRNQWKTVVKGPLVTETEAWAGMALRRQMQIAAQMPNIKRVAWITESMRNGGRQNLEQEQAKQIQRKAYRDFCKAEIQTKLTAIGGEAMTKEQREQATKLLLPAVEQEARGKGLHEPAYMLNDFYLVVLPKLADKVLAKAGAKVGLQDIVLDSVCSRGSYGSGVIPEANHVKVPMIEMTPQVKELLSATQPLYSRSPLHLGPGTDISLDARQKEIALAMARTQEMLGSARHLRFAKHVYDVATGHKVAGRYINQMVQVSLAAQDILLVTEHECFHFAAENLMTGTEVTMLQQEFASGNALNMAVRKALLAQGMRAAAEQCSDPMEAAAHGFSLWTRGELEVSSAPARGLFSDLVNLAHDCVLWFKRTVLEQRCTTVEEVFQALSSGELAQHRSHDWTAAPSRTNPAGASGPKDTTNASHTYGIPDSTDDDIVIRPRSRVTG
jgi:hypothetical protein